MIRWMLPMILVSVVAAQKLEINGLYGCNPLNVTALDQCSTSGGFSISYTGSLNDTVIPEVMFTSPDGSMSTFNCVKSRQSVRLVKCVIPEYQSYFNTWQSVRLRVGDSGKWSNTVSPGVFIGANYPGAPCPLIDSISSNCASQRCSSGKTLTIVGSQLLDNNSYATVTIAPAFNTYPQYQPVECTIYFDFSMDNTIRCSLPSVPTGYIGINLQVRVTNQWGSGIITGPLMYALSTSSSSSSTGSYPPWAPPIPDSGSSSSSVMTYWLWPAFFVVALVGVFAYRASRRSARRRALLLTSPNSDYAQIQHQSIQTVQPMYTPHTHVAAPVMPQNVHTQQYVQPQAAQYQPPVYQQQQYSAYQPSAPSVYPHVHHYQQNQGY